MASTVIPCPACATRNRVDDAAAGRPRCGTCHVDLPWLIETDSTGFDRLIGRSALPTLVDLWAPWCGPCRAVAPALEQIATERAGSVRIVKVNVDRSPDLSARLGVQGIPTMVLYVNGTEVARNVGALPADGIRRWLDAALSLR